MKGVLSNELVRSSVKTFFVPKFLFVAKKILGVNFP